jgi:hypothetical protein
MSSCTILPSLFLYFAMTSSCYSQIDTNSYSHTDHFSVGLIAGEYGNDSGIGIELSSPMISGGPFCVRSKGIVNLLEQYKAAKDHWAKYTSLGVFIVFNTKLIDRSRVYFEVGTFSVIAEKKFADKKYSQGYGGSVGVELFIVNNEKLNLCYYFSGGFNYLRAHAEKLENKPLYGNGFIFNNGLRFYF